MTSLASELTRLVEPAPAIDGTRVSGIRHLVEVASRRRFRAIARRELRTSARHAMAIVILAAVVDMVWLIPSHPEIVWTIGAANLLAAAAALTAYLHFEQRRRIPMEPILLWVLVAVDGSIGTVARLDDQAADLLAAGYFLLLPAFVALLLPWSTRMHASWVAVHLVVAALIMQPSIVPAVNGGPKVFFGLLLVSSAGSLLGHFGTLRARVGNFLQLEQIRLLNRDMRRRDLRLTALNVLLERAAVTDPLTGLGNRAALHEHLAAARNRVDRYGERFAVLMLDLDHFKAINDTMGHFVGDDVLRQVARAINETTRASDGMYRFGGEEFLSIARLDAAEDAHAVAERLRVAVESLRLAHPANTPHAVVTVSVGATIVDRSRLAQSDDAWLHAADVALYTAKREGRNRSVIA